MERNCLECRHWFGFTEGRLGTCRAEPPKVVGLGVDPGDLAPSGGLTIRDAELAAFLREGEVEREVGWARDEFAAARWPVTWADHLCGAFEYQCQTCTDDCRAPARAKTPADEQRGKIYCHEHEREASWPSWAVGGTSERRTA